MANDLGIETAAQITAETVATLQELGQAGLGEAVAALGSLLTQEAKVSAPKVEVVDSATKPFGENATTLLTVQQTQGLNSKVAYAIAEADAKKIAAMMMGGSIETVSADPIDDLEQGAVIEAISQFHNAYNNSLGGVLGIAIESDLPESQSFNAATLEQTLKSQSLVALQFTISLGNGLEIPIVQYLPAQGAQEINQQLNGTASSQPTSSTEANMSTTDADAASSKSVNPVTVRPVEFSSFDQQHQVFGEENKNLDLVMDVTLSLTVELGRTQLSIKDVLELTRGSVIELDRVAGEPVDLLANGKLIAKGEVVVIEDNFGLRITSIVSPAERLRGM